MRVTQETIAAMTHFALGVIKGVQYSSGDPRGLLDDIWLEFGGGWDINIWVDPDSGEYRAAAHRVTDGLTNPKPAFPLVLGGAVINRTARMQLADRLRTREELAIRSHEAD